MTLFPLMIVAAVLASPALPASEVGILIDEKVEVGLAVGPLQEVSRNRTWITDRRVRIESGSKIQIYDAAGGRYTMIDGRTRTWYSVSSERLHQNTMVPPTALIGMAVDEEGDPAVPASAFRKVGIEMIDGARTQLWETTAPDVEDGRTRLWFSTSSPARWRDLQSVVRSVFVGANSHIGGWFDQVEKIDGYPLRIERVTPRYRMVTSLVAMKRVPINDSLFEEPSTGFEKTRDPSGLLSLEETR